MELTKNHRQSLLSELEKAQQDAANQNSLLNKKENKDFKRLVEWFEISEFLAKQRISLIQKVLIENEIDY